MVDVFGDWRVTRCRSGGAGAPPPISDMIPTSAALTAASLKQTRNSSLESQAFDRVFTGLSRSVVGSPTAKVDTFLSDPSLHYLAAPALHKNTMAPPGLSTSPTRSTTASSLLSSSAPNNLEPTPSDLLLATPPTILKLLALTAPVIHAATDLCELVCWQKSIWSSLLLLLGWWAVCLGGPFLVRFGLNGALLGFLLYRYVSLIWERPQQTTAKPLPSYRRKPMTLTPASYSSLLIQSQTLAAHVQSFRAAFVHPIARQLSFIPPAANKPTPAYSLAWLALTSYPFYLALTWLIPVRLLLLVLGSVAILWQAPFFQLLCTVLWRSAAVRWACRIGLAILRGGHGLKREWAMTEKGVGLVGMMGRQKVPAVKEKRVRMASSLGGAGDDEDNLDTDGEDIQVQFTVFENQRWWVGLDWTHALLPGERASW